MGMPCQACTATALLRLPCTILLQSLCCSTQQHCPVMGQGQTGRIGQAHADEGAHLHMHTATSAAGIQSPHLILPLISAVQERDEVSADHGSTTHADFTGFDGCGLLVFPDICQRLNTYL